MTTTPLFQHVLNKKKINFADVLSLYAIDGILKNRGILEQKISVSKLKCPHTPVQWRHPKNVTPIAHRYPSPARPEFDTTSRHTDKKENELFLIYMRKFRCRVI
jgi:hypothetical protein